MQTDWQKFLLARSAPSGGGHAPPADAVLADISHAGLIRAEGADAVAFLQGQLSTDIEKLNDNNYQLSSWSNAKGRVVTLFHLFRQDDAIHMALPAPLLPAVLKRLSMYVLRSKVTLTDASDRLARFGLAGVDAKTLLAKADMDVPADVYSVTNQSELQVIRLHGQVPRYTVKGPVPALSAAWEKLETLGAQPAGHDAWVLRRILAGEPSVHPETTEHFVAQMIDLDKLGGIDFKKGCYIGQEVIARAHYRGAVKRHLHRARSETSIELRPGMDIHAKENGAPVAEIVDARRDTQGAWQMLLVVQDDAREAALVHASSDATVTIA